MATKDAIIAAIQAYVDGLGDEGNLDLKRALGSPGSGPIELRNETVDTGVAYVSPGFLDSVLKGIEDSVGGGHFVLVFGASGVLATNRYLIPGFGALTTIEHSVYMPTAATLISATVRASAASGAGATSTFRIRKNEGNTGEDLVLSGDSTTTDDWTGSISYNRLHRVAVRCVLTGVNTCANAVVSLLFRTEL